MQARNGDYVFNCMYYDTDLMHAYMRMRMCSGICACMQQYMQQYMHVAVNASYFTI